jgi:hypothetical protein
MHLPVHNPVSITGTTRLSYAQREENVVNNFVREEK